MPIYEQLSQSQSGPAGQQQQSVGQQDQQPDGTYIEFRPTGRSDTGTIRLTDEEGNVKEVTCDTPTELFHVVDVNR